MKIFSKKFKRFIEVCFVLWLFGVVFVVSVNAYILNYSEKSIKSNVEELGETKVGLVLWALVYSDGSPSPVLADRLIQAYNAYKAWKIEKIIVSGDNWRECYNEPENMEKYLVSLGVDKNDIYLDYAWFDTYDSFYRAKEIFGVKELVVFTQNYHLSRSIYIWNKLWMKTVGVKSDLREYYYMKQMRSREILSRLKAFLEVEFIDSKPKFLGDKVDMTKVQDKA